MIRQGATNVYQRTAVSPSGKYRPEFIGPNYFFHDVGGDWLTGRIASASNFEVGVVTVFSAIAIAGTGFVGGAAIGTGGLLGAAGAATGATNSIYQTQFVNPNATASQVLFAGALGTGLGIIAPGHSFASAGGAAIGYSVDGSRGAQIGDLVGGVGGTGYAAFARKAGTIPARLGYSALAAAPEVIGAGAGGYIGYQQTGTFEGAMFGASIGSGIGGALSAKYVKCFVAGTPILVPLQYDDMAAADIEAVLVNDDRKRMGIAVVALGIGTLSATQYLRSRSNRGSEEQKKERRKLVAPTLPRYQKFGFEN
jgi:hypothetical protein